MQNCFDSPKILGDMNPAYKLQGVRSPLESLVPVPMVLISTITFTIFRSIVSPGLKYSLNLLHAAHAVAVHCCSLYRIRPIFFRS